jgi:hypothetical protein
LKGVWETRIFMDAKVSVIKLMPTTRSSRGAA